MCGESGKDREGSKVGRLCDDNNSKGKVYLIPRKNQSSRLQLRFQYGQVSIKSGLRRTDHDTVPVPCAAGKIEKIKENLNMSVEKVEQILAQILERKFSSIPPWES